MGQISPSSRRSESSFTADQKHLRYLFTTGPIVTYVANPSAEYTFISDNVATQLGYEANEFLQDPGFWLKHIHPEEAPRIVAEMLAVFQGETIVVQYRFLHKNGTYRLISDALRLVQTSKGTVPYILVPFFLTPDS